MNTVIAAIIAKYDGSDLRTVAGPLYLEQAPQGTSLPYGVLSVIVGSSDKTFDDRTMESMSFRFNLWATGASDVMESYRLFTALFDECVLNIEDYNHRVMYRSSYRGPFMDPDRAWGVTMTYVVRFQEK